MEGEWVDMAEGEIEGGGGWCNLDNAEQQLLGWSAFW